MNAMLCPVCQLRAACSFEADDGSGVDLCEPCWRSLSSNTALDAVITWAAERARYFHGRRPIECSGCKNVVPARGDCPHCGMPAEIDGGVPTRHRAR